MCSSTSLGELYMEHMDDDFEEAEIGNIVVVCELRTILNTLALDYV